MVLASCMILLPYLSLSSSNHFEWDNYHWGEQHQDPPSHPIANEPYQQDQQPLALYQEVQQSPGHYEQHQQNPGHFHYQENPQQSDASYYPVPHNDQFQGYPVHRPSQPLSTMPPPIGTVPPTTQITPVPNSVPKEMPKHRILLKQLYQQVLGPNFTSPATQQLAFLSSAPSLPLNSQVQDHVQPQPAETQYELAQYIEPPLPPHIRDQFNYYS